MSLKINAFLRQNPISSLRVYVRFDLIVLKDKANPKAIELLPMMKKPSKMSFCWKKQANIEAVNVDDGKSFLTPLRSTRVPNENTGVL